jgi:hippurate hydrolase
MKTFSETKNHVQSLCKKEDSIMKEKVIQFRRDLHQIPELELHLPKTTAYIKNELSKLDCKIIEPFDSCLLAFFDAKQDHAIAYRTDMDALPVKEMTGLPFESKHEGCMHACGHDGHMAIMLGFANVLNEKKGQLKHNVLLIFQPGEETPGGARLIVERNLLEQYNVKAIFGTHVWPLLEKGVVATRANELMARSSEMNFQFYGKSSHAARYKEGIDALETAVEFVHEAYEFERSLPADIWRLLRFGVFQSGTVRNVVSDYTLLQGTLRAFAEEEFWYMRNKLEVLANELQQKTGTKILTNFSDGYPAVINDEKLAGLVFDQIEGVQHLDHPEMISEDFSWYQTRVPGVFFFLGTGKNIELHNACFDLEEDILMEGVHLYEKLLDLDIDTL